jgi:signal transduction histidine kinase
MTMVSILVLGVFLWQRVSEPAEGATIPTAAWDWDAAGAVVVPVGPDTPFLPGDRVIAIAGRSLADWADRTFGGGVDPAAVTDPLPMVVDRDGSPVAMDVPLGSFPVASVLAGSWALVTFTLAQLVLATWLLVRRPASVAVRVLFVGSVANLASAIPWQLGLLPSDLVRGWPAVLPFVATGPLDLVFWSSLLHLILVYPTRSRILVGRPWLPATLYLVPILALLAGAVALRLTTTSTLVWVGGWVSLQAWVVLGVLVTSLAGLVVALRRLPETLLKGIRWVVIALIAAAVLAILLVIAPLALTGSSLAPRGILALLALPIPIALAVAIARDRMFERDQLLRSRERLVTAREEERRRLRRRLHDGIGPTLAAMTIQLDVARDQIRADPGGAEGTLDRIKQQTQDVLADIRGIARELRPPALDEVGLVGALRQRADELSVDPAAGILVSVVVGDDLPPLPAAVEVAAYRIATEAMLNAVRHGSASHCWVRLRILESLLVEIEDDGGGLPTDRHAGVGIAAMRERATELGGTLDIGPRDGGGTRVLATLPWQA